VKGKEKSRARRLKEMRRRKEERRRETKQEKDRKRATKSYDKKNYEKRIEVLVE
jgi:hypothetical protein